MLKSVNTIINKRKFDYIPTRYDDITKELNEAKKNIRNNDYFEYIKKQKEYAQTEENQSYIIGARFKDILKKINQ